MPNEQPKTLAIVDSYIRNQTTYLQGSIVHADQKATFLLAILGILLGYLETRKSLAPQGGALVQWQGLETIASAISLIAVIFLLIAGCFAGIVVWPRFDFKMGKDTAAFVGIATGFKNSEDFASDMLCVTDEETLRRQLRSHYYRCNVCLRKWTQLKYAYKFTTSGFIAFLIYFVLAVIIRG